MTATYGKTMIHDPQAVLDYMWDWSDWLDLDTNELITAHTVSVYPAGEMSIASSSHDTSTVTAWVQGGTLGRTYYVTCHIETDATREDDRRFTLECQNR